MAQERDLLMANIHAMSTELYLWNTPDEFRRRVAQITPLINQLPSPTRRHRERVLREWREGWVLDQFPVVHEAARLRLVEDEGSPDAEIDLGGAVWSVEVTEAGSDEILIGHQELGVWLDGGPTEWRARIAEIPGLLEAAGDRKVAKPYALRSSLLVYLNIGGTYGIGSDEARAHIQHFTGQFDGKFKSVHVLWNGTVYGSGSFG